MFFAEIATGMVILIAGGILLALKPTWLKSILGVLLVSWGTLVTLSKLDMSDVLMYTLFAVATLAGGVVGTWRHKKEKFLLIGALFGVGVLAVLILTGLTTTKLPVDEWVMDPLRAFGALLT